jgi:hypothetical protein
MISIPSTRQRLSDYTFMNSVWLPVHEWADLCKLGFLSMVEETISIGNVEYVHFGKPNDTGSLPVLVTQGTVH